MIDMGLELVPIGVSDVDRAKEFYAQAGFDLNVDVTPNEGMRVVQLTPPGSRCSIVFGTGMGALSDMAPGALKGLHLVTKDIETARRQLLERGVEIGDVYDVGGVKYANFEDPDGNLWLVQQFPAPA
jgi:catechol 2,3-dioxygenase-like lactoylglutathione lyase family enzyme